MIAWIKRVFFGAGPDDESLPAFFLIVETKDKNGRWFTNINVDDLYIVNNLIYQHGANFDLFHFAPRDSKAEIRGRIVSSIQK